MKRMLPEVDFYVEMDCGHFMPAFRGKPEPEGLCIACQKARDEFQWEEVKV